MKNLKIFFILLLLLFFALFFRTYRLSERGLVHGDEIAIYSTSGGVAAHLRWWIGETTIGTKSPGQHETLSNYLHHLHLRPNYPFSYGVAHVLLGILILFLTGPTLFHFLLINAALGTATVAGVFWLTRRLEANPVFAWMVSLALALSSLHIIWSRSGFPHLASSFFLILGYACYAQGVWSKGQKPIGWLFGAGVCLGVAFAFHPTIFPFLGACFLTELYRLFRGTPIRYVIKNIIILCGGILLIFGLLEGLIRALHNEFLINFPGIYGKSRSPNLDSPSYLDKVLWILVQNTSVTPENPAGSKFSTYLRMPFLYGEGVLYSVLATLGFGTLIRRLWKEQRPQDFFVVVAIAFPFLLYLCTPIRNFPRNIVSLVPLVALLVGHGLYIVRPRGDFLRWGILLLFISIQFAHFRYLFDLQSPYAKAQEWLTHKGSARILEPSKNYSFLYTHGVRIFHLIRAKAGTELVVREWPTNSRRSFSVSDPPFYTSVIGNGSNQIPKLRINRDIRVKKVRVMDRDGKKLGILTIEDALAAAKNQGLDLVEVAPNNDPPICRIVDYELFQDHQNRTNRANKQRTKALSALGPSKEKVKFPNQNPFMIKKIELLKTILSLAQTMGLDKAAAWADRQLKREKKVLDATTLRLLQLPWPPSRSVK